MACRAAAPLGVNLASGRAAARRAATGRGEPAPEQEVLSGEPLATPGRSGLLQADLVRGCDSLPGVAAAVTAVTAVAAAAEGRGGLTQGPYAYRLAGEGGAAVRGVSPGGAARDPTKWTILQQDGPNHLGLW